MFQVATDKGHAIENNNLACSQDPEHCVVQACFFFVVIFPVKKLRCEKFVLVIR